MIGGKLGAVIPGRAQRARARNPEVEKIVAVLDSGPPLCGVAE
jgi:hypothetical protein